MARQSAGSKFAKSSQLHPSLIAAANAYNAKDMPKAKTFAEKAFKADKSSWQAAKIAGMAARRLGDIPVALQMLERALRLQEDSETRYELASTLKRLGRIEESLPHYEHLLHAQPNHADGLNELGSIYLSNRMLAEAEQCFRRAIAISPQTALFHANLAKAVFRSGKLPEAVAEIKTCLRLDAGNPEWHTMLAKALTLQFQEGQSIPHLEEALRLNPRHEPALVLLAAIESNFDMDAAMARYRLAHEISGRPIYPVLMATLLPPVMGTRDEILASRGRVDEAVDRLLNDTALRLTLNDLENMPDTHFYFAFHGLCDRDILSKISRMYRKLCPDLDWVAPHVMEKRPAGKPLRIGFVSMFFFKHSIGIAFSDLLLKLAQRDDIEVNLIALGHMQSMSAEHQVLVSGCDHYLPIMGDSLADARDLIAARQLDVLIYPDIGMSPFSKFLAHFRLAQIQCVMGGHPDTTGVDTLDYFLTWDRLELPEADEHYSERLVRLKHAGSVFWEQPVPDVSFSKSDLGIPECGRSYLCPMKMQKMHPDFDVAIRRILEKDPEARVLLVQDETFDGRNERFRARVALTVPEALMPRVIFLPWIRGIARFFSTCAMVDVVLDSFPFGAGTTSLLLSQAGIPIVTLPGRFCRGRVVAGLYQLLGVEDTIASDVENYCDLAVALAADPDKRRSIGARMRQAYLGIAGRTDAADELAQVITSLAHGVDTA